MEIPSLVHVLRLDAGHDRNGNPLLLYVVLNEDGTRTIYDAGYAGWHIVPAEIRSRAVIHEIKTNQAQWTELVKEQYKP